MKRMKERSVLLWIGLWLAVAHAESEESGMLVMRHQQVVELNTLRLQYGLPPLKLNEALCEAAQMQAEEILQTDCVSHFDRWGRRADARALQAGYFYTHLAENLAAGQPSWERALQAWQNSLPHRSALFDPHYREVGIGSASLSESRYRYSWAQVFGTRRAVYPVIINLDAFYTAEPTVRVYIHGARHATAMRVSTDGKQWSDWMSPQEWLEWEFPPVPGEHTLWVQLQIRGWIFEASDSIYLIL